MSRPGDSSPPPPRAARDTLAGSWARLPNVAKALLVLGSLLAAGTAAGWGASQSLGSYASKASVAGLEARVVTLEIETATARAVIDATREAAEDLREQVSVLVRRLLEHPGGAP